MTVKPCWRRSALVVDVLDDGITRDWCRPREQTSFRRPGRRD